MRTQRNKSLVTHQSKLLDYSPKFPLQTSVEPSNLNSNLTQSIIPPSTRPTKRHFLPNLLHAFCDCRCYCSLHDAEGAVWDSGLVLAIDWPRLFNWSWRFVDEGLQVNINSIVFLVEVCCADLEPHILENFLGLRQ